MGKKKGGSSDDGPTYYKIAIFGSGGVGKSCLTFRFQNRQFLEHYNPTILDSYMNKTFMVDGVIRPLEIMDTAGQDEYKNIRDLYLKTSDGLFIVYDVTDKASFREVNEIVDSLKVARDEEDSERLPPTIIIGNKCDLNSKRQVSHEDGRHLASVYGSKFAFEETSSKEDINVIKVFEDIVRMILAQNEELTSSKKKKKGKCILL